MKKLFKDKKKLLLIVIAIFIITSLLLKIIPSNIGDILTFIIFPIYFFVFPLIYWKYKKFNDYIPILLTLIYIVIGYILIGNLLSPLKILIAYLSGEVPLLIAKLIYKIKARRLSKEEIKVTENQCKIISVIMPLLIIVTLEWYYTVSTFGAFTLPTGILSNIVGLILIYSFYMIILSMSRNTSLATKIYGTILLILYIINEGRIYYTSDPLQLADIFLLKSAGEVASLDVTFINCAKFLVIPTILVTIIIFSYFKLAKKSNIKVKYNKKMIAGAITSVVLLLILFIPNHDFNKFTVNYVYDIHDGYDLAITASNIRYYKRYGVISGMYGKIIESRRIEPDNYDESKLNKLLADAVKIEGKWGKPNIIVIFSESFWDVTKIKDIKFDKEVVPNFNNLKDKGITIEMISPSYGGISSNVEFEILTGGSLNYYSKGYTPYIQLFRKGRSEDNPSIIRELKNNGYKTKILNSSSSTMFDCDYVYDIYDVDERNHLYDEIDLDGEYVTDEYLTDQIIDYFNNKPKDEKIFFFTITMGGHMPYYEERYDNYDVNIVESPYDKDINEVIHSYSEGIYLADQQLGRLYDYINTLDEDTIIVFFGDHLPHLATPNGQDALFRINYIDSDYDLESAYRQFNTTALILSNYELENDDPKYLSPDLLMTYVLNNMDIELSPFYKWLYTTKDNLPSSNSVISQDKNGKLYYTLGLEKEMKDTYDIRKKMQYMLFK